MIEADEGAARRVALLFEKLIGVDEARAVPAADTVARELALFKVSADSETRREILEFADIFRGTVVDVSKRSVTIEITGADAKIQAFERMIRPFGLIEMVRTGEIAISRGRSAT